MSALAQPTMSPLLYETVETAAAIAMSMAHCCIDPEDMSKERLNEVLFFYGNPELVLTAVKLQYLLQSYTVHYVEINCTILRIRPRIHCNFVGYFGL